MKIYRYNKRKGKKISCIPKRRTYRLFPPLLDVIVLIRNLKK